MDLTPPGDDLRPQEEAPPPADSRERIDWDDPADETPVAPELQSPFGPDEDDDAVWTSPHYLPLDDLPPAAPVRTFASYVPAILIIVLALGLVAATLWGIREYRQRARMLGTAQEALALISAGAPPELVKEMSAIQGYLDAGQTDEATQRLASLRTALQQKQPPAGGAGAPGTPATPGGPGLPGALTGSEPIPESAYDDLKSEDAKQFFRQHQDLFRRFLIICAQARQLKESGQNVDALRKLRDDVIEAARLGQQPAVEQGMQQMATMMGAGPGPGGGGGGRGPLGRKAEQLKREVEQAARQGRDVRAVFPLMQQAEQAAQAGNFEAAGKFIDQALDAVHRAPRGRGGFAGGPGGDMMRHRMMAVREGRTNPLAPFLRTLLGVMGAEEANLKAVTDELIKMRQWVINDKPETPSEPDTLKPMIDRAMGQMQSVAERRQALTRAMRGQGGRPGPMPAGGQERRQLTPEQRRAMYAVLTERLVPLLDKIRGLSDGDYKSQQESLIRELVRAVMEPPREPVTPTPATPPLPTDPEQRVRAKMLEASKVVQQWELAGKDTKAVDDLFAQARKALYARQYADAEKLVDEARKLLGLTEASKPAGDAGGEDSTIKLNLRGRP